MTGFRNVPNIAPQLQSPVTQLNGDHRPVLNGIDDVHAADFTSGNVTLTLAQAQAGVVTCTGATAPRDLIWPHGYTGTRTIVNASGQVITVKTDASGTTVAIANGATVDVLISGNDVAVKSGVSSLSVTAPITDSGTTTVPVVGISAATSGAAGSMSAADKAKLDAAASANTNSVLVLRDASGRAQFTDPSASQDAATKASVAAAIAAAIVGADTYKGTWNASTNTPTLVSSTGTQGWHYRVATAGTTALDGISDWAIGDWAYFDGTAWQKVDNTDQVTSVQGRQGAVVITPTDLSLVIGTDVQAYDAKLAAIVALTWAANKIIYTSGASTAAIQDFTALAQALLACATQGDMQNAIGLILGTTVQAYDAELAALASLVSAANKLPYFTGLGTAALADFTAAGRALVDDADAAAQRTTLAAAGLADNNIFTGTNEFDSQYWGKSKLLTDGATIAIDWNNGNVQYVTIGATGRTVTFANPKEGARYLLAVIQDIAGSKTITTWPTIKWRGGSAPVLSTTANYVDLVTVTYIGGVYYGNYSLGYH